MLVKDLKGTMELTGADIADLTNAKALLENTSLAARIANAVGAPIEKLLGVLPPAATEMIAVATRKSIAGALNVALSTVGRSTRTPMEWAHKVAVGASGAVGGLFGLPALALELPVSTTLMLRSIAEIAKSEGETLTSDESRLACVQVFAFGGTRPGDDAAETGYYAVRIALATSVAEAVEHVATRGVAGRSAPVLVRLTTQIASRFGVPVSQKLLAQSVPIIGAAGGAAVNLLFIQHFQNVARGHFIVRRLERVYGAQAVKSAYMALPIEPPS